MVQRVKGQKSKTTPLRKLAKLATTKGLMLATIVAMATKVANGTPSSWAKNQGHTAIAQNKQPENKAHSGSSKPKAEAAQTRPSGNLWRINEENHKAIKTDGKTDANNNQTKYASIKTKEANIRKGPGTEYPLHFIIKGRNLPVQVKGTHKDWTLIETQHLSKGWIKSSFISYKNRYATNLKDQHICRMPSTNPQQCQAIAALPQGANLKIIQCGKQWCRVQAEKNLNGWVQRSTIWGLNKGEKIE